MQLAEDLLGYGNDPENAKDWCRKQGQARAYAELLNNQLISETLAKEIAKREENA